MARTGLTTIEPFIPNYWDQVLGENLYPNLYLYQFGTKRQVPRNFGTTIKIPRIQKQNIVGEINTASYGAAVTTNDLSAQFISGTMKQFAGAYRHGDVVIMTALSDIIDLSLKDISRDIAKRMDTHIRDQLSGTGAFVGGSGAAASASVATASILKSSDILKAAVTLDAADNPRPTDGHYPLLTHPWGVYDLQSSLTGNSWLEMNKYGSNTQVEHWYRGEIGRIFGARIVTSTNVDKLLTGLSTGVSGYRSMMFAPDSYYVTEINEMTAKTFVKPLGSGGTWDPVNQIATVGAKVFFTAIPANWGGETRMVRIIHGSSN